MDNRQLWARYRKHLCSCPSIGLSLDISRMNFADDFFVRMEPAVQEAYRLMDSLESGALANPDEHRMVGHYWLRAPGLAPDGTISKEIVDTQKQIKRFAAAVHAGRIRPRNRKRFTRILSIGIGGSALGPQFLSDVLGTPKDRMKLHFFDNTDPDGFDRVLREIGPSLAETLTLVISKSGGTAETRNGMIEAMLAYKKAGLDFSKHAVAVTGVGSKLYNQAVESKWVATFPMWDWVGGRTSVSSAVGLLPLALQGVDFREFLEGERLCDELTRSKQTDSNPSSLLALMWFHATSGRGAKDMVVLPYKDRLQLFSKYLQQLVMESLGKEFDLNGKIVNQGISVYGNKGTTDQHAYVQQLREGPNNFFVTFIGILRDRAFRSPLVEPDATCGDYLYSYLLGTRSALFENGRESLSIILERLDPRSVGALIALFERAVGLYASLVNINAYHQPGVEAGKKMAGALIDLQRRALSFLRRNRGRSFSVDQIFSAIGSSSDTPESLHLLLEHLAANKDHAVLKTGSPDPFRARYVVRSRNAPA